MFNLGVNEGSARKWGADLSLGTPGDVVSWSIVGPGEELAALEFTNPVTGETPLPVNGIRSRDPFSELSFDVEARLRAAFADWSEVANVEFIQVEDQGGAAGVGETADVRFFFGNGGPGYDAFAYHRLLNASSISGDLLFDMLALSRFNNDPQYFQDLALHEIGHTIGLDHVGGLHVMNPNIVTGTLQQGDIDGAQTIYGAQDNGPSTYRMSDGQGDLVILDGLANLTIIGNARDNDIHGTGAVESIEGGAGQDRIFGGDGRDMLFGGGDADRLEGGGAIDRVMGDAGNDRLFGGAANDFLYGGAGGDFLDGGAGVDRVSYETAAAGVRADLARAGSNTGEAAGDRYAGVEDLAGSAFDDTMLANGRANRMFGEDGDDRLFGRAGNDRIFGGDGDDLLEGGPGRDLLTGGAGGDRFLFRARDAEPPDIVRDFDAGDSFILRGFGIGEEDLTVSNRGAKTLVIADGTVIAVVRGDLNELDESDVLLIG
ncbi:MAG: matrixin family metalloprotease [Pseudomonadota bacterium]